MKLFKLFAFLVLLLTPGAIFAEAVLLVELQDGSIHRYEAEKKPIVTISDKALVISTPSTSVEYAKEDFARLFFEQQSSSIDDVSITKNKPTLLVRYIDNETLEVCTDCHGLLRLFNINGSLVNTENVTDGSAIIDLSAIPSGIYLLNISNQTIKISKK